MPEDLSGIFRILSVAPNLIQIEVVDPIRFKDDIDDFCIGSYIKISDDSNTSIIALVQSYKIKDKKQETDAEPALPTFVLDAQPIGFFDDSGKFRRGGQQIAIPPSNVEIASKKLLKSIYEDIEPGKKFIFSSLAHENSIDVPINGDKFFSKHIAVVGSTGSGKSGTVAKILQEGIKPSDAQSAAGLLNNTHIILFDLHGEYPAAFPDSNKLNISNLVIPYWMLNSEEMEEMFLESQERNFHNQSSQFKKAVTLNKEKHNIDLVGKLTYDTPVYFSLEEVLNYIRNINSLTVYLKDGVPHFASENMNEPFDESKLWEKIDFYESTGNSKHSTLNAKVSKHGGFNGEFDRFISRLETKVYDGRLNFLLHPKKVDGSKYHTSDLPELIKQFVGYVDSKEENITIIDLSGIPFEVLSLVVSLISRLVFDLCFHYKPMKKEKEVPFLLVLEEAHNYIPKSETAKYRSVKKSIERIAKEGRKYGLSLMIVSQRPSEISETIFSQCNNFIAMRLTNPTDQQYVKRLMPDNVSTITDTLPVLERQEALIIGDSIPIPTIVRIKDLQNKPDSNDIDFRTEWSKDWVPIVFEEISKKIKKE